MLIKNRFREKAIRSLLITLLFLGTGIYSCAVETKSDTSEETFQSFSMRASTNR